MMEHHLFWCMGELNPINITTCRERTLYSLLPTHLVQDFIYIKCFLSLTTVFKLPGERTCRCRSADAPVANTLPSGSSQILPGVFSFHGQTGQHVYSLVTVTTVSLCLQITSLWSFLLLVTKKLYILFM